ncbi:MAG TPA: non-homologous end-joining DNA ligase [Jatrophihabitans sp.]|nr:non-homologous end-joining DNA ligase [Jatrophihabitans sp.]
MLASAGTQPLGEQWIHEVKWDGMRVLADLSGGRARLLSRTGRDITAGFPELAPIGDAVSDALFDGEIIALSNGLPSFEALAERMHVDDARRAAQLAERVPVTAMAFDLLRLYGVDLTGRPWQDRRASLDRLELAGTGWSHSPVYLDGPALLAATREQGLEGVVAKRRTAGYQPGQRSRDWIKTLNRHQQACLVGGWRRQNGTSAERIGALLLGIPDATGLRYAGRAGSGLSARLEQDLRRLLAPLARPSSPFAEPVPAADASGAVWCEPRLVVEVRHLLVTGAGRLRQPVLRGIRTDLDPAEVRRES